MRARYETRVLTASAVPPLTATSLLGICINSFEGILIGGFDPIALGEMEIWAKLVAQDPSELPLARVLFGPFEATEVEPLLPPSLHASTYICCEAGPWRELIQPDRPGRSFAAIIQEGLFRCLMVGPPTEEAWDMFSALASAG